MLRTERVDRAHALSPRPTPPIGARAHRAPRLPRSRPQPPIEAPPRTAREAEAEAAWTALLVAAVAEEARRATMERLAAKKEETTLGPQAEEPPPRLATPTELLAPEPPSRSAPTSGYALSAAADWPPAALPPPPRASALPRLQRRAPLPPPRAPINLAVVTRGVSGNTSPAAGLRLPSYDSVRAASSFRMKSAAVACHVEARKPRTRTHTWLSGGFCQRQIIPQAVSSQASASLDQSAACGICGIVTRISFLTQVASVLLVAPRSSAAPAELWRVFSEAEAESEAEAGAEAEAAQQLVRTKVLELDQKAAEAEAVAEAEAKVWRRGAARLWLTEHPSAMVEGRAEPESAEAEVEAREVEVRQTEAEAKAAEAKAQAAQAQAQARAQAQVDMKVAVRAAAEEAEAAAAEMEAAKAAGAAKAKFNARAKAKERAAEAKAEAATNEQISIWKRQYLDLEEAVAEAEAGSITSTAATSSMYYRAPPSYYQAHQGGKKEGGVKAADTDLPQARRPLLGRRSITAHKDKPAPISACARVRHAWKASIASRVAPGSGRSPLVTQPTSRYQAPTASIVPPVPPPAVAGTLPSLPLVSPAVSPPAAAATRRRKFSLPFRGRRPS